MIHYWECRRCTHQWTSSCMGAMMTPKDEQERLSRQISSHLCWDCFEQLEAGEISGLELYDLYFYLHEKSGKNLHHSSKYSGMCHEYRGDVYGPDGKTVIEKSNFVSGFTLEQTQLFEIVRGVEDVYRDAIALQRTAKRIELDGWQATLKGRFFFGPQPRPENFIGDPPGKQRLEVLFGLDMTSGSIVPPHVQVSDGIRKPRCD